MFVLGMVSKCLINPRADIVSAALLEDSDKSGESEEPEKVKGCDMLRNRYFLLAAVAGTASYFAYAFQEPLIADRLTELSRTQTFIDQPFIGAFFMILQFSLSIAATLIQYLPS